MTHASAAARSTTRPLAGTPASRYAASLSDPEPDYPPFAAAIRGELGSAGPLDGLLVDLVARAAWPLRDAASPEDRPCWDAALRLHRLLDLLKLHREVRALHDARPARADNDETVSPVSIDLDPRDPESDAPVDDAEPSAAWRDRLVFDPSVSRDSPVVRGTWVTVRHVVALVVDGWTWDDILRTHPELSEPDLRACLAYAVENDAGRVENE